MATLLDTTERDKGLQIVANSNPELADNIADALGFSGGPITTDNLTPQKSFNISNLPPTTQTAGLLGEIESGTDTFTKDLETQAQQAQKDEKSSFEGFINQALNSPGQIELSNRADETAGVNKLDVELKDINNQILREQVGLRRRIEAIQENKRGLFGGAVDDEVQRAKDESLKRQADMYVIQQGVQGRYDSAKAIADRAVAAQFEQQERNLKLLELNYNRNKDLFSKSEQRLFETKQGDRERKLKQEQDNMKQISDFSIDALQNGAPTNLVAQMRQAKTVEEAIRIGGQYVGKLDRAYKIAQIQKIGFDILQQQSEMADITSGILSDKDIKAIDNSPQGKKLVTAADLKLKLSSYQDLVEKYGFEQAGVEKSVLENAYKELQLAYKEAANLGVLNGPDLSIVESALANATPGFFGNTLNVLTLGGGTRKLTANLEQAQKTINSATNLNLEQLYARNPRYRDSQYVQSLILPFGDELITSDEVSSIDAILNK